MLSRDTASHIPTLDFICYVLKRPSIRSCLHTSSCHSGLGPGCSDKPARSGSYTASFLPSFIYAFTQQISTQAMLLQVLGIPQRTEQRPYSQGAQFSGEDRQETNGQVQIQLQVNITLKKQWAGGGHRKRSGRFCGIQNALLLPGFSGVVTSVTVPRCPQLLPSPT